MKFCPECQSVMSKQTDSGGEIEFVCKCRKNIKGGPDDTLMAEEYLETAQSDLKHAIFLENAAHDPANPCVYKDCPTCGINFLTMVRIGEQEQVWYVCGSCDYRATNTEYMQSLNA